MPTWQAWLTAGTASASTVTVWGEWVNVASTGTTTATEEVWRIWNDGTTGSHAVFYGNNAAVVLRQAAPALTPQQEAELARQETARRQAREEEARRRAAERAEAEQRAERLLLRHLNPRQRRQYRTDRYFTVIAGDQRRRYKVEYGMAGNVKLIDRKGRQLRRYCIHPVENVPAPDVMLAQVLMLKTNEEQFLRIANAS